MSSPQNTTMFGFFCCAGESAANASPANSALILTVISISPSFLECKNFHPVVLHADDDPLAGLGLVECLVEPADVRLPVVGRLSRRIVVVNDERQPPALAGRGHLQHLQIAVRISEGR